MPRRHSSSRSKSPPRQRKRARRSPSPDHRRRHSLSPRQPRQPRHHLLPEPQRLPPASRSATEQLFPMQGIGWLRDEGGRALLFLDEAIVCLSFATQLKFARDQLVKCLKKSVTQLIRETPSGFPGLDARDTDVQCAIVSGTWAAGKGATNEQRHKALALSLLVVMSLRDEASKHELCNASRYPNFSPGMTLLVRQVGEVPRSNMREDHSVAQARSPVVHVPGASRIDGVGSARPGACAVDDHGLRADLAKAQAEIETEMIDNSTIAVLPLDAGGSWLGFLAPRQLLKVSSLSRCWRTHAEAEHLWKPVLDERFPTATLFALAGCVENNAKALYLYECKLAQSMSLTSSLPEPSAADFDIIVLLIVGGSRKVIVADRFGWHVNAYFGDGWHVNAYFGEIRITIPPEKQRLPISWAEARALKLTITVVHQKNKNSLRFCQESEAEGPIRYPLSEVEAPLPMPGFAGLDFSPGFVDARQLGRAYFAPSVILHRGMCVGIRIRLHLGDHRTQLALLMGFGAWL